MQQSNVPVEPKMVWTLFKTEQNIVFKEKEKKETAGCERSNHSSMLQHLPNGNGCFLWTCFFATVCGQLKFFHHAHQVFRQHQYYSSPRYYIGCTRHSA